MLIMNYFFLEKKKKKNFIFIIFSKKIKIYILIKIYIYIYNKYLKLNDILKCLNIIYYNILIFNTHNLGFFGNYNF